MRDVSPAENDWPTDDIPVRITGRYRLLACDQFDADREARPSTVSS